MTVEPPNEQRLTIKPLGLPEAKPIGTAIGRYAALQQVQTTVLAPAPGKEQQGGQQLTQGVDAVDGGKGPRSATSDKQESQPLFSAGDTQVPVVAAVPAATPELAAILAANVAGVSPHAPDPPRRERHIRKGTRQFRKTVRLSAAAAAEIAKRAAAADSEEAPFLRSIIYEHLKIPTDREEAAKYRELQKTYADLTIAFNRVGTLLNQVAAASNRGQPCPLSRAELDDMRHQFSAVLIATTRKLGFD